MSHTDVSSCISTMCPTPTRPAPDVLQDFTDGRFVLIAGLLITVISLFSFWDAWRNGRSDKARSQAAPMAVTAVLLMLTPMLCSWLLPHVYQRSVQLPTRPPGLGWHLAELVVFLSVVFNLTLAFGWFGLGRRRNT